MNTETRDEGKTIIKWNYIPKQPHLIKIDVERGSFYEKRCNVEIEKKEATINEMEWNLKLKNTLRNINRKINQKSKLVKRYYE